MSETLRRKTNRPKFAVNCIYKDPSQDVIDKLHKMGYVDRKFKKPESLNLISTICGRIIYNELPDREFMPIDCGVNERLFLALAALREDSVDKYQWFTDGAEIWEMPVDDLPSRYMQMHGHKAEKAELIAYFGDETTKEMSPDYHHPDWQEKTPDELNDAPIIENHSNNIKNSEWNALHEKLAQTIIDFFKEKGLPAESWALNFSFDCLEDSVNYGKWCPMSDSSLSLINKYREAIIWSM